MRLGTLTALDISRVRTVRQADGTYRHPCVACGHDAWTGEWHSQCTNPTCSHQVLGPLDTVAAANKWTYRKSALVVNAHLRREQITEREASIASLHRRILSFWIKCCRDEPVTMQVGNRIAALREKGFQLVPGQRGAAIISAPTIRKLVELAAITGADFPDSLLQAVPSSAMAYAVQILPYRIDRIVLTCGRQEWQIIWREKKVGFTGLIGLHPGKPRWLAANIFSALSLQCHFNSTGYPQEVAAVFFDRNGESAREDWGPDTNQLTAVVSGPADVPLFAEMYDTFPAAVDTVASTHGRALISVNSPPPPIPWPRMRRSYLAAVIGVCAKTLSPEAVRLMEQSCPTREEISWLVQRFREKGKLDLAESIRRHMENRVITVDRRSKIRETASEYIIETGQSITSITNFTLQFESNLLFRDSSDVYHAAKLVFGRESMDIHVPAASLENPAELQRAVRNQLLLSRNALAPEQLPTVIDTTALRRYIIPYFKKQVSALTSREGYRNLGWTLDRNLFVGPGLKVDLNGCRQEPVTRHPGVVVLRQFSDNADWNVSFASDLPPAARDMVAMILAGCVRYFVRGVTRPLMVLHSPEARHLLTSMFQAIGQREIFELNPNIRDTSDFAGVRGYPLLTTGHNAAQAATSRNNQVLLTDAGYRVEGEISQGDAEAAGRSLQAGLLRVVEWCLATGAEEFSEVPALYYHSSLLREGKWLIEHVCELQPWEVSDLGLTHLEQLLSQIPFSDTRSRLALRDGTTLIADFEGLQWDRAQLEEDLQTMQAPYKFEEDRLEVGAVVMLPALSRYYGKDPEVRVLI